MSGFARTWGGEAAEAALLLHCSLAHSGAWDGVARALVDRLHMLAPDLLNHGKAPEAAPDRDFHDQVAEQVAGFLPDTSCHLIGHSFGATVALRLAIEHPDRVASLTLIEPVLFAAAGDSPARKAHEARLAPMASALAAGDRIEATRLFLSVWGGGVPLDRMPDAQARYMTERIGIVPLSNAALHSDGANLLPRLGQVNCPVLMLEGSQTHPVMSDILAGLQDGLSAAERQIIPRAGHMAPITHPGPVADAIRAFLHR